MPKIEELPDFEPEQDPEDVDKKAMTDGNDKEEESDDDDMPPPLEDMSDTIKFKQRFNVAQNKKAEKDAAKEAASAAAAAAAAAIGRFSKGTIVELMGLSNAKFNGMQGTVTGYLQDAGRHMVRLTTEKIIKVKPDNLKRLDSFSGFGKGFLSKGGVKQDEDDDDNDIIKPKAPEEKPGMFSEVQEAMKNAAPFLEQNKDQWCTPDLMSKLAKKPELLQMMQNPQFMAALNEFQRDPKSAMVKYGDNPKVSEFFRQFCGVMGEHLSQIGEKEGEKHPSSQPAPPPISTSDEKALEEAMAKPGVKDALQDIRVQKMIADLRDGNPKKAQQITAEVMRNPELSKKVQLLMQAGLLGTAR